MIFTIASPFFSFHCIKLYATPLWGQRERDKTLNYFYSIKNNTQTQAQTESNARFPRQHHRGLLRPTHNRRATLLLLFWPLPLHYAFFLLLQNEIIFDSSENLQHFSPWPTVAAAAGFLCCAIKRKTGHSYSSCSPSVRKITFIPPPSSIPDATQQTQDDDENRFREQI